MDDISRKNHSLYNRDTRTAPPVPRQMLQGVDKRAPNVPTVNRTAASQPQRRPEPVSTSTRVLDEPPVLELGDEVVDDQDGDDGRGSALGRFFGGYWRHKLWALPLTLLILLVLGGGAAFALPVTRYKLLGLFIERTFAVTVTDSVTGTPVSGARIVLDGQSELTDSSGYARLTAHVGQYTLHIAKAYYKDIDEAVTVDVSPERNTLKVPIVATGRQVPVKVINKITGKPIPSAVITVGAANAKTDQNGQATITLSASADTQNGAIAVDGYNDLKAAVQVTTSVTDANTFAMVPTGKMYFLSNLSGKIDVVSANLDGSNRKTVLAGTGSEDTNNTMLLASRDWEYMALLSKRDGGDRPKLFLISTSNDKVSTIDDGTSGDISPIGWSDHYFVYQLNNADVHSWQPGASTLKSYLADGAKSITLASTSASGTSDADSQYQTILQTALLGGNLVYTTTWYHYPGTLGVSGQQNALMSIKPDGTSGKTLKAVDAGQFYVSSLKQAKSTQAYFAVYDNTSSNANYYRVDANGTITDSSTITSDSVNQTYPTYLLSPSGQDTFWSESRDGKNTLLVGDENGNAGSQIASLSDYAPYGWFSDSYVLVQKNKSELYLMSADGSGTPLKVSDYYKPQFDLLGYGGSYGGL